MGSIRRKTFTKPPRDGAEVLTSKGAIVARWKDTADKTRTALPVEPPVLMIRDIPMEDRDERARAI
jgi:hypothetical protein